MKYGDMEITITLQLPGGLKVTGTYYIERRVFEQADKLPQETLVQVLAKGIEQMWTAKKAMMPEMPKRKRRTK